MIVHRHEVTTQWEDVVAVSASSVYRVLKAAGVLDHHNRKPSRKGTGSNQPSGPQFIAKDFKEFIRICGMTHVRTSPYYPQSNGKLERYHRTIKGDCIRPGTPLTLEDARRLVGGYVENYNEVRLHSALGYVAPADKLYGRETEIFAARDAKLEAARRQRAADRTRGKAAKRCYTDTA